jgi:hypothetical protein
VRWFASASAFDVCGETLARIANADKAIHAFHTMTAEHSTRRTATSAVRRPAVKRPGLTSSRVLKK